MPSPSIAISPPTHELLAALAAKASRSPESVLDDAVRAYYEKQIWAEYHEAYARLRADPAASEEFDREFAAWDVTLSDGLEAPPDGSPTEPIDPGPG